MTANTMFFNYTRANLKRLLRHAPQLFVSLALLLTVTGAAAFYVSEHLYQKQSFATVSIGYYLPDDEDLDYNQLGIGMLTELEGMQETVRLSRVASIDEGYNLLKSREILYLVIVPEHFFSGVMDSTNPPLDIVVYDDTSLSSYVINELFMSYAALLGNSQAGIYSGLDTMRSHGYDVEQVNRINDRVNLVYLDRVMNKSNYQETVQAEDAGDFTLTQSYLALAVLFSLCFTAFVLIPCLKGGRRGLSEGLSAYRISRGHILIADTLSVTAILYLAFFPCFVGISIWQGYVHPLGLLAVLPVLLVLALLIAGLALYVPSAFSANLCLLCLVLVVAYAGGGLLPDALLPGIVRNLSSYLPGRYLHLAMCRALFG